MYHSEERRIMRLVLLAACLALAHSTAVKDDNIEKESVAASVTTKQPLKFYHKDVGIPEARRLKKAEKEALGIKPFIVGGDPSPVNAYPYLVGLVITMNTDDTSVCSSSMLTTTRAVTAAHCWWDGDEYLKATKFELVFGSDRLYSGGVRVETDDVEMHADWDPKTLTNDIAMIKFDPVAYTDAIKPVALPSDALLHDDFAGDSAQAAGFGLTNDDGGNIENAFQNHVTLQVITNEACEKTFESYVTASTLCTSGDGGKGACIGDSGGPLTITSGEQTVLIGVSSFVSGVGCEAGKPSAYTRVTSYAPWIQDRIQTD